MCAWETIVLHNLRLPGRTLTSVYPTVCRPLTSVGTTQKPNLFLGLGFGPGRGSSFDLGKGYLGGGEKIHLLTTEKNTGKGREKRDQNRIGRSTVQQPYTVFNVELNVAAHLDYGEDFGSGIYRGIGHAGMTKPRNLSGFFLLLLLELALLQPRIFVCIYVQTPSPPFLLIASLASDNFS